MKQLHLSLCALTCLAGLSGAAFADVEAMAPKSTASAHDVVNPYHPRYGHPYRHGSVPTKETHEKMKTWAAQHGASATVKKAATGPQTLGFNGGVNGIGVTSGTPKVYLVIYGSQWGTAGTDASGNLTLSGDSQGAVPYLQNLFKGLGTGGELWSGTFTQYCDGPLVTTGATSCPAGAPHVGYPTGGALAGVWYDNSAASPSAATGNQLAQEAVKAAQHFGNTTAASNRYAQYVILSPTGMHPDGFNTTAGNFCAWHDYTGDTGLSGGAVNSPYGDIAFTNMPYVADMGASCGANMVQNGLDGFSIVEGHEYAETVTDQNPGGGWFNLTTSAYAGQENGDECAWISTGQGATAVVNFSTGRFAMQSTWSNDTNQCEISHPIVLANNSGGTPSANFTNTVSGLSVQFTDTSTDTGGTLGSHSWSFGDGTTSTSANPAHTYASAGTYSVSETVSDSVNGSTSVKTASVTVSAGGTPSASFTSSVNGLTATFTDQSSDTGGKIGNYSWTFGDGSTSTLVNPVHSYVTAGTYSVTETVKDSVSGKTSSKTAAVTVTSSGISQVITNGGFETGSKTPWSMTAGVLCSNAACPGESAHAGSWFAWLNGYGAKHVDTVSQTVTLPAGKKTATLSFWLHINTGETANVANDTLNVQILSTTGSVLRTLATYSNLNAASGYTQKTFDVSAFIGKTVVLKFTGSENGSLQTSFVLDDVSLSVQ